MSGVPPFLLVRSTVAARLPWLEPGGSVPSESRESTFGRALNAVTPLATQVLLCKIPVVHVHLRLQPPLRRTCAALRFSPSRHCQRTTRAAGAGGGDAGRAADARSGAPRDCVVGHQRASLRPRASPLSPLSPLSPCTAAPAACPSSAASRPTPSRRATSTSGRRHSPQPQARLQIARSARATTTTTLTSPTTRRRARPRRPSTRTTRSRRTWRSSRAARWARRGGTAGAGAGGRGRGRPARRVHGRPGRRQEAGDGAAGGGRGAVAARVGGVGDGAAAAGGGGVAPGAAAGARREVQACDEAEDNVASFMQKREREQRAAAAADSADGAATGDGDAAADDSDDDGDGDDEAGASSSAATRPAAAAQGPRGA